MDPNSKGFGAIFTGSEVMRGPDTELESEPESEARAGDDRKPIPAPQHYFRYILV